MKPMRLLKAFVFAFTFSLLSFLNFAEAAKICTKFGKELDLSAMARATISVGQSPTNDVAKRLQSMRQELLSKVGSQVDRSTRETNIKNMEAWLRAESFTNAKRLKETNSKLIYDAVIVGTGPHALFALASLLKEKPNARVLVLAKDDTAGATFREGYSFNINSSSRPSGVEKPLPGFGNINELPGLPIQVTELTSVRYPEAADLGDALVANAYAVFKSYQKNVDILFDSEIPKSEFDRLAKLFDNSDLTFNFTFADPLNPRTQLEKVVTAQYVLTATGLGDPKKLDSFFRTTNDKKALRKIKENGLPGVATFEEFIRLMADSENPWDLLKDLKIAIVGDGNSADVTAEFLLGLASPLAYGSGVTQGKALKQISWIGQKADTCLKFITEMGARIRYAPVASGLKSSDPAVAPQ